MAIIETSPGIKAEILVDGHPLKEYTDNKIEQNESTKTTYIEAQSGAYFTVSYACSVSRATKLKVTIIMDGVKVDALFLTKPKNGSFNKVVEGRYDESERSAFIQRFRFQPLQIEVEGNRKLLTTDLAKTVKELGMITVRFEYFIKKRRSRGRGGKDVLGLPSTIIPETALKGSDKTHQVTLGSIKGVQRRKWVASKVVGAPFAIFNFKYRSLHTLRSLGLIPRTPTPVPLEERPEEELTRDELRELVRTFKKQKADAASTKKKAGTKRGGSSTFHGQDEDDDVAIVKSRPTKRIRRNDQEVIVLD